jgi:hypothetical protein
MSVVYWLNDVRDFILSTIWWSISNVWVTCSLILFGKVTQKWTKNRSKRRDIDSFESNDSKHETLIRRKIDVASARRWQKTSRAKDWNCTKSWRSQRVLSSRTCVRNALSSLIICSFDACLLCYRLTAFTTILDKRSSTCCFSAWTEQQTDNACLESTKRRIYASYWTSRRDSKRRQIDWWKSIY